MEKRYEGQITHTEESIIRMYKMSEEVYGIRKLAIRMFLGGALVIGAFVVEVSIAMQGIMIMLGTWLLVSRDFSAKCRAEQALEVRKKKRQKLPKMITDFYEDYAKLKGEGCMKISYKQFECLVEDETYIYLFLGRDSVCMLEKQNFTPQLYEEFKAFIEKKTGVKWQERKSWFHMNLYELLNLLKVKR